MSTQGETPESRPGSLSWGALFGFLLGVLAIVPLLHVITGLPALILGFFSLRQINSSPTPLRGRRLAIAAMILGLGGVIVGIVSFLSLLVVRGTVESQRTVCANNLRQIALGSLFYQQEHAGRYPRGSHRPEGALGELPEEKRLSWLMTLLPYLDHDYKSKGQLPEELAAMRQVGPRGLAELYRRFDQAQPWDADVNAGAINTTVRLFLCPASPHFDPVHHPALTSYAGMAGLGLEAPFFPLNNPAAGLFGYDRVVSQNELVRGTSYTLMATETTSDNGAWAAAQVTLRGVDITQTPLLGEGRPFGGCHPGGANLLFADGHVTFFNAGAQPERFYLLIPLKEYHP